MSGKSLSEPGPRYDGPGNPTHGLASTYRSTRYKCRCEACRAANTALQMHQDAKRRARLNAGEVDAPHGVVSTYLNWGCRCTDCKQAHAEKLERDRKSRADRLKADPSIRPHGSAATYNGWGCRCSECTTAATVSRRARRAGGAG